MNLCATKSSRESSNLPRVYHTLLKKIFANKRSGKCDRIWCSDVEVLFSIQKFTPGRTAYTTFAELI